MRVRTVVAVLAFVTAAFVTACLHNRHDAFPLEVGFTPLDATLDPRVVPPTGNPDPYPQALGPIITGYRDGYGWAQARAYLKYPIAQVYEALHHSNATFIHVPADGGCFETAGGEPFPVSYVLHYHSPTGVAGYGDVHWDLVCRAGISEGTDADLKVIGQRCQKTYGTSYISMMADSIRAYPAADPSVTEVEFIVWLNAPKSAPELTIQDVWDALTHFLANAPDPLCGVPARQL